MIVVRILLRILKPRCKVSSYHCVVKCYLNFVLNHTFSVIVIEFICKYIRPLLFILES